jgi:ribonucleoside-diphosphate reductase subunit M1
MYATKAPNGASDSNGVPTPVATPPPATDSKTAPLENALAGKPFKADAEEGDSPKVLASDPISKPDEEVLSKDKQEEDAEEGTTGRDGDIYADAVLACSIENPEACVMCSG